MVSSDTDCEDPDEFGPMDPLGDCDDSAWETYPGAPEICDGADNNCDSMSDEGLTCAAECSLSIQTSPRAIYALCVADVFWDMALNRCQDMGMQIVRIDDAAENEFVRSSMVPFAGHIWIGGSDLAVTGEWRWPDGNQFWQGDSNGAGLLYANWFMGEPNNFDGNEHCSEMVIQHGQWNDQVCTVGQEYVCELY